MLKYIYRDLLSAVKYLPYGLAIGIPVGLVLVWLGNKIRKYRHKEPAALLPVVLFGIYCAVMLVITFFSRESGSRKGVIDLELFSTWGRNDRNHAFVVENVLLFIPYGFLGCWAFEWAGRFLGCMALGTFTSLCIESLQLITGRGYFQIDDILTNMLGTFVGFLAFRLIFGRRR